MRIGVLEGSWWKQACEALGHEVVSLPHPKHPSGNNYQADLSARIANGKEVRSLLEHQSVDFLLDNGGAGLGFVPRGGEHELLHEAVGVPLISHFIDPLITAFQGIDWDTTWHTLQWRSWGKAIWDRAQAIELQQFGIPNVIHLPMAAPNRRYDTTPLDPARCRPVVSFVGAQNTSYFLPNSNIPTSTQLAGVLTQSVRSDAPGVTFHDVYHNLYQLEAPPQQGEPLEHSIRKTRSYFNAKIFHHAWLSIRNRDRFVIFLSQRLGERFELIGRRWDTTYGLKPREPFPAADAYFDNFRQVAINLNVVNGNAETGLNMRHFEITAAGGFMLCYDQPELADLFEVGKECAVFHSEQDLLDKIEYYLAHPEERAAIAQAGQMRTLSQHLYSHRLATLLQVVRTESQPAGAAEPTPNSPAPEPSAVHTASHETHMFTTPSL